MVTRGVTWKLKSVAVVFVISLNVGQFPALAQRDPGNALARQLAALHDLDALSISPDGRWAIVQERIPDINENKIHTRWNLISLTKAGAVKRIFDGGESLVRKNVIPVGALFAHRPIWSRQSEWFIFTRLDGKDIQLWRGYTNHASLEKLTDIKGRITSYEIAADDRTILLELEKSHSQIAEALASERDAGFLFDQRFVPSVSPSPLSDHPLHSPNLASAAPVRTTLIFSLVTGETRPASPEEAAHFRQDEVAQTSRVSSSRRRGGKSVEFRRKSAAWTEAQEAKLPGLRARHILVARLDNGDRVACRHAECMGELQDVLWRDSGEIVFSRREVDTEEQTAFYSWKPEADSIRHIMTVDGSIHACESSVHNSLTCFWEAAKVPKRLIYLNLSKSKIETVFNPNPSFPTLDDISVIRIPIRSNGASVASAILAYRHGKPGPLVITTYTCGGFLRGSTGDEYPVFPLVASGFSVMCLTLPAMRGFGAKSTRPGAEVSAAFGPGLPYYRLSHAALRQAVDNVKELGLADTRKRAITGLSNGATFAIYEIERGPYTAAITSSGTYSSLMRTLGGAYKNELFDYWGIDDRFMREIRPDPDEIKTPLLINVSDQELLTTLPTYNELKAQNRAVEMYVFPEEYHIKWQPQHRLAIYRRNMQWLKFWLMGKEVDDPIDPLQYIRWRKMRKEQCELSKAGEAPWYCKPGALDDTATKH